MASVSARCFTYRSRLHCRVFKKERSRRAGCGSSTRNSPSRSQTTLGHRLALGGGGGPGIARPRVGGQEVPGAGDLDPAAVDRLEPAAAVRSRRRPAPGRPGRGNGPGPCWSPSRRRGRLRPRRSTRSRSAATLYQLQRNRCTGVVRCSSRSTHFRSLPPWPLSRTHLRMPWVASESTRSVITRASVEGSGSWPGETASGWSRCRTGAPAAARTRARCSVAMAQARPAIDLDLEGVGAVGQMEVVRLGRAQGQDGDLERGLDLTWP